LFIITPKKKYEKTRTNLSHYLIIRQVRVGYTLKRVCTVQLRRRAAGRNEAQDSRAKAQGARPPPARMLLFQIP